MTIRSRNVGNLALKAIDLDSDSVTTAKVEDAAITVAKLGADVIAILDLLTDLPTENVASPAIWNDGGVLKVGSA